MAKAPAKVETAAQKPVEKALRDGFGEAMLELGAKDPRVFALSADLTESDRLMAFKEKYPERFVYVGVAEQNLVGMAAGMAHVGKIPFVASFAVFCPGRTWDQIRVSCCYSQNNVKIYGGHAGITVGEDGATHQALEDVAILRCLPQMTVIVPADATQMRKATLAAVDCPGPVYLRGGRAKQPQVTTEEMPFTIGKAQELRKGTDITIVACGIMVREAMLAAEQLAKDKISARVLNMHTIKPLDADAVIRAAHDTGAIVTVEEHQIDGGLGSAVAEAVSTHYPVPIEMVGMRDLFGESGTADELLDKYGMRASDIITAVRRALQRKREKRETLRIGSKDIARITGSKRTARVSTRKTKGSAKRKR